MYDFESLKNYHDFEELVFKILVRTNPYKLDWIDGGRDRGRDLEAYYYLNQKKYKVLVECKYYSNSVNIRDINGAVDWAKVSRPDLLYFWTVPYLTPDTKDFLKSYSQNYGISIDWEDAANIKELSQALHQNSIEAFENLRNRIINHFNVSSSYETSFEYESRILKSDHFLIDRVDQMGLLLNDEFTKFYIHGLSGSGKTQLVKNVARTFHNKGFKVFWHSILIEDDPNIQLSSFLDSLAQFLLVNHKDSSLMQYLKEYGYFSINPIVNLITGQLNDHTPLIFIDDFHKCKSENLLHLLNYCISNCNNKFFFIAWYNILNTSTFSNKDLKYIRLDGLNKKFVEELLVYTNGDRPSPNYVNKLIDEYQGLPYYVILSSTNISNGSKDFEIGKQGIFLQSLLKRLSRDEQLILNILSISRDPIRINSFQDSNLKFALFDLVNKKLVGISGDSCYLHDLLKAASTSFFFNSKIEDKVVKTLKLEAKFNPAVIIDLLRKQLLCKNHLDAWNLLEEYFKVLLNEGYDLSLLDTINKLLQNEVNFINLILLKISLLERLGEYRTTLELVHLLNESITPDDGKFEDWIYTKLRILYFNSKFDLVIQIITNSIDQIRKFNGEIYIQIMFILGRCYYVKGDLNLASTTYLFVFFKSLRINKSIVLKSLHRLAMVEEALGFDEDALRTFQKISGIKEGLTKKRESYALYRIAKCQMKLGKYREALKSNENSIKIKENLNHKRGLVFSYKLNARIYYSLSDYDKALYWAERSYALAQTINIEKEIVSSGVILSEVMLSQNITNQQLKDIIKKIVSLSIEFGLNHRIRKLKKLLSNSSLDIFNSEIQKMSSYLDSYNQSNDNEVTKKIKANFSQKTREDLDRLHSGKRPITPILLAVTDLKT
ncbi:restriction endonuclease [Winogradskyella sp.]|uniref:restriction endonuclease n=1 Tax=Winogradskyella sp. TaxID=1883156 RepID=UPI003BAA72C8